MRKIPNTFGIDVTAARFLEYGSEDELRGLIAAGQVVAPWLHIGGGSNLLFIKDYEGTVLHSRIGGLEVTSEDEEHVSVTERTREIGLRMSVGARGVDILSQFLIEAILISITGGIIGVIIGCGASWIVKSVAHWPIFIQPWSVFLSFAVCTVTGVFFGWYPAKKAADLDPIEAIRYE